LIGPNASGKTTFLDVVAFLGSLVSNGLEIAVGERTQNFQDLLWKRSGSEFELAIEAAIPEDRRKLLRDKDFDTVRYEVSFGIDAKTDEIIIQTEKVLLKKSLAVTENTPQINLFPRSQMPPESIVTVKGIKGTQTVINKVSGGNDNFYSEVYQEKGKGWAPSFKLGPRKSALGNLPEDESKFPVATWLKRLLADGVQQFVLNSMLIRKASPPGQIRGFKPDGSNLPWVIDTLKNKHPNNFLNWIEHLQTALPDLVNVRTIERPDDKHRYLVICYCGGLEIPSWMASDGTLRLLALTLPAYLPDFTGVYLIEEPENGIHPRAVETMFQSLSSVYDAQILLASHSPVILSMVRVEDVLCFAKTPEGATDIVLGSQHPALRDWQGETNLGVLFAGGVLG
jgi:predicted ATPase